MSKSSGMSSISRLFVDLLSCPAMLMLALLFGWTSADAQTAPQVMQNHVRSVVSTHRAALVSAVPAEQRLNFSIILPLRNQTALTSLLARLYDPTSPDYRKFLTVGEFTDQFGPSADDYAAVLSFAQANGFTVTGTPANRLIVPLSGTAGQVNQAFHVQMNVYQHPTEQRTFFSLDREPSLDLNVAVSHISGLDDFSLPHPMSVIAQGNTQPLVVTGSGPGGSYLGSDMRAAYYGGNTLTGIGQAVGIVEFTGYTLSDVNATFTNAGQTYSVPINNVLLDNAAAGPGTSAGGEGEAVLDIVQAIGMAPGLSQVRVYIGTGPDQANVLNSMASDNIAKQLSCSWSWSPADPKTEDVFFLEMAAQGQSFFAASGDYGAFSPALSPYFYPQEDGYVTAVGGTSLRTNGAAGSWASESAWNASPYYGTGGGISPDAIPLPTYQSGLASSANGGSTALRNVPDVAMEGDFDNYNCQLGSCSGGWAGTSFAAPRWAGFMALVNQQAVGNGNAPTGGVGFLNPPLYVLAEGSHFSADLHDIITGNNLTYNQPLWYSAVTGYDLTTGWGSPTGQSLIDDLAGPQVPGFFIGSTPTTVYVNPGSSSTVSLTVIPAGGFTGNVTMAVTSTLPSGVTAALSPNPTSGTTTLTLTATTGAPTTSTPITITGTSGSLTATTTLTANVHPPGFGLTAYPSAFSVNLSASASSTVSVAPQFGFTGAVSLSATGLPSGVTASFSPATATSTSTMTLTASSTAVGGPSTITITGTSGTLTASTIVSLTVNAPSFSLSGPGNISMGQGSTYNSYVSIYNLYGFTGNVNLVATGLPAGVTASFSPNPATGYSSMTLVSTSSSTIGQSTVTVTGTSGSLTASTTFSLGIFAPTFTLSGGYSVSVGQGSSTTSYTYVNAQYGFNGNVTMSVTGLPAGVTASFSPNPTTYSSVLTITASSSAAVGQYALTITGTSGKITAATTLSVGVFTPTFTLSSSGSVSVGTGTSSGTAYVYTNPMYGFAGSVTFAVTGLPAGVTAAFSQNPTTSTSVLMTLTATNNAAVGQFTATITGTSGTQTASTPLTVGVFTPTFTISNPGSISVGTGTSSSSSYLYVNPLYGFAGNVTFSISGLPAGCTASFSPNPSQSYTYVTITATSSAAVGQYTATITGTSGTQSSTAKVTVGVYTPTFSLTGANSVTVGQGGSNSFYYYLNDQYGFNSPVTLSVSGLPSGVTASFSPNPTTNSSILTLTASSAAAPGQYNLVITGTSGALTSTVATTLNVYPPTFTLNANSVTMGVGTSTSTYVYLNGQYGFNGAVNLSVSGLPAGVTASFSPNPTTYLSTLTLTASSSAAIGSSLVTVTGTYGSQTASTAFSLGIFTPTFSLNTYQVYGYQGVPATGQISIYTQYGFTGNVTLGISGLPSGVTASIVTNPTNTSSNVNFTIAGNAPVGTTNLTVTGTSGNQTATATMPLYIQAEPASLSAAPSSLSISAGAVGRTAVSVNAPAGYTGVVALSATGLPSGVTATFTPSSTSTGSILALAVSSAATAGTSTITITGMVGTQTVSTTVVLTVLAAPVSTSTTTTLALTANGGAASSVAAGTMVTAKASVIAGSTPVTQGLVNFCASTATACDAAHVLGSAQLTSAGSAVFRFLPGPGNHIYQAVFVGTSTKASSTSDTANLAVTGSQATTTSIAQTGSAGSYTLTGTVTGKGSQAPSGTVSFLDTSNGNSSVATATLGSGTSDFFGLTNSSTVSGLPQGIAAGDFNEDGIPDLVAGSVYNSVQIALGNGNGTFRAGATISALTSAVPLVADFDHDGHLDVAISNGTTIQVFLGKGDGTFNPATSVLPYGSAFVVGDFNGDGLPDFAGVNNGYITIYFGNGDGTFRLVATNQNGYNTLAMAVSDFNGDGIQDLAVVINGSPLQILTGNGDGTFATQPTSINVTNLSCVAVGDFNRDGKPDLILGQNAYVDQAAFVALGNGDGTFTAGSTVAAAGPLSAIATADFNQDGKADVITAAQYSGIHKQLLGNGDGTFAPISTTYGPATTTSIAIGDWNGDGVADVAISSLTGTNNYTTLTSSFNWTATATGTGVSVAGGGPTHYVDASYTGDTGYKGSVSATTALTSTTNPTGPAGYTYCAPEKGTCNITALSSVAYGANGSFNYGSFSSPVSCTNAVFGDPASGYVKACFYLVTAPPVVPTPPTTPVGPTGYTYCAAEHDTCNITALSSVAFGANGSFNYGSFSSPVSCSNMVFGDPASGVVKACFYLVTAPPVVPTPPTTPVGPTGYTYCAAEHDTCYITALSSVAFGANGSFNYGNFSSAVACSNTVFGDPASGVVKSCFYQVTPPPVVPTPPTTPVGPTGYTYCAAENGTCSITSLSSVAFGANGSFNYGSFSSDVSCSNKVFGDPASGVVKACFYQVTAPPVVPTPPTTPVGPAGYTYCAAESGTCNITTLSSVAFGANGSFNYGSFSAAVPCSNTVFGDPASGVVKACFYKPVDPSLDPTFTYCAAENGICSFNGTATVAFGVDGAYNYGTFTGSVSCSNSVFNDPYQGVAKACYYKPD